MSGAFFLRESKMKEPFAYVLYIDRGTEEHLVSLYKSLDEAEDALRVYSRTIVVGLRTTRSSRCSQRMAYMRASTPARCSVEVRAA
jgi:hypothetical protein